MASSIGSLRNGAARSFNTSITAFTTISDGNGDRRGVSTLVINDTSEKSALLDQIAAIERRSNAHRPYATNRVQVRRAASLPYEARAIGHRYLHATSSPTSRQWRRGGRRSRVCSRALAYGRNRSAVCRSRRRLHRCVDKSPVVAAIRVDVRENLAIRRDDSLDRFIAAARRLLVVQLFFAGRRRLRSRRNDKNCCTRAAAPPFDKPLVARPHQERGAGRRRKRKRSSRFVEHAGLPTVRVTAHVHRQSVQIEFFLSCLGFIIGIGNTLRFPSMIYNHGGIFFLPYLFFLAIIGYPLVYL